MGNAKFEEPHAQKRGGYGCLKDQDKVTTSLTYYHPDSNLKHKSAQCLFHQTDWAVILTNKLIV